MRPLAYPCVMFVIAITTGCAGPSIAEDTVELEAELAVGRLGAAIVNSDSKAFFALLAPELLSRIPSGVGRETVLAEAIQHQRSGWIRTLGKHASNPRVHSVRSGYGDLEVTLDINGTPSEKKLYFERVGEELRFSGVTPKPGPAAAVASVIVNRKFAIENFVNANMFYAYGGDWIYGTCPGTGSLKVNPNSVRFDYYNCTEAGFLSCQVSFSGTYDLYMNSWCGGQHNHSGTTGCWWQWIGDDLWFPYGGGHGTLADAVCNP